MSREIKFRSQRVDSKGWVYGFVIEKYGKCYISYEASMKSTFGRKKIWIETEVVKDTVCQYTGLKDKNGKEIYEGDYVKWTFGKHYWEAIIQTVPNNKSNTLYAIETYHNCTSSEDETVYTFQRSDSRKGSRNDIEYISSNIEVIGNIYESPELLIKNQ